MQRWVQGNPESPVGRGAPKADTPGELFWTGAFSGSDIYYVAVDQTGPYTGSFTLQVSGSGVAPAGERSIAQRSCTRGWLPALSLCCRASRTFFPRM